MKEAEHLLDKELTEIFLTKKKIFYDYSEMCDGVFYYQDQQIEIRNTVVKMLIGTMAISGSFSYFNIGVSNFLLTLISLLIPIITLTMLTLLLFNDLVYKEGLKLGFLSEAKRYEKENSWITPYHECLVTETKIHDEKGTMQISLYFGCAGILLLISALSLFIQIQSWSLRVIIICGFSIIFLAYKYLIIKSLKHPKEILEKLES